MKIWRPYTQMHQALEPHKVLKANGAYLYLSNGQKVLDGISSWWVITHGHCHPEISEAISIQSQKIDQVVFANFTHEAAEELTERLAQFIPENLSHVFFSDNGSTAVEVAMKMAYQACAQSGKSQKKKFIAFEKAYHGDTCGAMSVSADGVFTQAYGDLRFEVLRCHQGLYLSDAIEIWLQDFLKKIEMNSHQIAAVIIEPLLQGAGGMVLWPIAALNKICEVCREHDILIIFDEVMTGFGRTGKMFSFEHLDFTPDFLCLSKGLTGGALPLSLTLTTQEVYEQFLSTQPDKMFFHGHSFTGNAISCAAASANLRVFQTTQVLEKICEIEKSHFLALNKIKDKLPLKDSRVLGNMGAIELNIKNNYGGDFSKQIYSRCLAKGLFLRPLGNVIYLMPPYCTTPAEVEQAWDIIAEVCGEVL